MFVTLTLSDFYRATPNQTAVSCRLMIAAAERIIITQSTPSGSVSFLTPAILVNSNWITINGATKCTWERKKFEQLECGPMPNVMAALCSTSKSLADAQYWSAVQ